MDMALDDIISQTKSSRQGQGGGRGRRGISTRTGGVFNNRGGGGGRRFNGGGNRGAGKFPGGFTKVSRGGGAERNWSHDQYDGGRRNGGPALRNEGSNVGGGSSKITVSNLHFGVSDDDIAELFSEMGNIRYASVHYDRSGRSLGKADVVFERRGDAQKAIAQYNGVPLDGRDMSIDWASSGGAAASTTGGTPRKNDSPLRQTQDGRISRNPRGGPAPFFRGGRGGGRGRGGFRRTAPGPNVTAAELDAELDMYISQKS